MAYEIRVSKAGVNVLTATDPNDFIFHSAYNTFKILAEGSATSQTVNANPKTFTVAHSQSSIPAVYAFAKFPDGYVALPNESDRALTGSGDRYWLVEVDATNIYFIFYQGGSGNYNVDIKYYIFETPAS
jgi:hypothetical protein